MEISGSRGGGDDVGSGTNIVDDGALEPRKHKVCAFFIDLFFDSCYSVEYYGSVYLGGEGGEEKGREGGKEEDEEEGARVVEQGELLGN